MASVLALATVWVWVNSVIEAWLGWSYMYIYISVQYCLCWTTLVSYRQSIDLALPIDRFWSPPNAIVWIKWCFFWLSWLLRRHTCICASGIVDCTFRCIGLRPSHFHCCIWGMSVLFVLWTIGRLMNVTWECDLWTFFGCLCTCKQNTREVMQ